VTVFILLIMSYVNGLNTKVVDNLLSLLVLEFDKFSPVSLEVRSFAYSLSLSIHFLNRF